MICKIDMSAFVDDGNNITVGALSEVIGYVVFDADLTAPLDDSVQSRLRGGLAGYRLLMIRGEQI